jgi:hypothetical protein
VDISEVKTRALLRSVSVILPVFHTYFSSDLGKYLGTVNIHKHLLTAYVLKSGAVKAYFI